MVGFDGLIHNFRENAVNIRIKIGESYVCDIRVGALQMLHMQNFTMIVKFTLNCLTVVSTLKSCGM